MSESVYRDVDDAKVAQLGALAQRTVDYLFFGPPWQRIPGRLAAGSEPSDDLLPGTEAGIAVSLNDRRATPVFSDVARWGADYMPKDELGGGVEIVTIWPALTYVAEWTEGTERRTRGSRTGT